MTVTYVSSEINHHICELCEKLYSLLGNEFVFVATGDLESSFRKGYAFYHSQAIAYEPKPWYRRIQDEVSRVECQAIIDISDVVIIANTEDDWVYKRLKKGKLTFRAHERWYREPLHWYRWPRSYLGGWRHHRFRNLYMLCASAYTAADVNRVGCFRNKCFNWGYFPELRTYENIDCLIREKDRREILWCGRLIDWKHPDDALHIAKRLMEDGYQFHMTIAGVGALADVLRQAIEENRLTQYVSMAGSLNPNEVRKRMEKTGIYLFTSDFKEGWGAVLNEAMNSGCAVVASHAIGAVPYLMKDRENGYVYQSGDVEALYQCVKYLLDHPLEQEKVGKSAYWTIVDEWNAAVAAKRFVRLAERILSGERSPELYDRGICSKAGVMKNDWYIPPKGVI